jgi:o-succinylbenzoate---CoA ligase
MTLEDFLSEWNNDSDTVLVHTSGSTGKPKPMMVEKKRMLNSARITCDFLGLKPGDSALLCMSLDYIAGKMVVVRSIERHLHLISVSPSGHPLKDINLKDANGKDVNGEITFAAMVPMQVYNTLQVPEERERLTHIRHLIIGGGAIDASLEKELRSLPGNIAIWSTYGMTETLSHIALRRINGAEASEWYQPFDSVKISQTDEGCLVIDAPLVCAETLVTNDIVEIEPYIYNKVEKHDKEEKHDKVEKLRFRIKGRKDNVICSGGIKIQIEEVEALLKPHLEKPFMIAKKKDEKFGEIAVLLTEDEDLKKVEATIRRLLSGKSDDSNKSSESKSHKYWIPREYLHVEHLPLTETGKPKRSILL